MDFINIFFCVVPVEGLSVTLLVLKSGTQRLTVAYEGADSPYTAHKPL